MKTVVRSCLLGFISGILGAGCASPPPSRPRDPDLDRFAGAARVSFDHGAFEQAVNLYRRALERARAADDPLEIGNNAFNLAVGLIASGRAEEARPLLREARVELERAGQDVSEALLVEAAAARDAGQAEEAAALLEEVQARLKKSGDRSLSVQTALLRAQLACDRGKPAEAGAILKAVTADLRRERDPVLKARFAGVQARVARMVGQPLAAARLLDEEADGYKRAGGRIRELAEALKRAGQAWLEAGHPREASDRFYRAARSLFAQGQIVEALKLIDPALAAAEKALAKDLFQRTMALLDEIQKKTGQPATEESAEE